LKYKLRAFVDPKSLPDENTPTITNEVSSPDTRATADQNHDKLLDDIYLEGKSDICMPSAKRLILGQDG